MIKRIVMAAATSMALAVPFAGAAHAQLRQPGYNPPPHAQPQRIERWDARRHNGYMYQGRWHYGAPSRAIQNHRSFQPGWRAVQWNPREHNGYLYNGRWYYGEPSRQIMNHRSYEPGYRNWRRGDRLTNYHRSQYRSVDYRRERLAPPPRGYHYVRSDRGETLLVGIATGVILSVLLTR